MARPKEAATIRDVATVAGVSPSTVSKVLSGSDRISTETAERVLEVVRRLGYRPNSIAQSLRTRSTLTIGMINRDAASEADFALQMMVGVERVTRSHGFHLLFGNAGSDPAQERETIASMLDKQVDGLIFVDSQVRARETPPLPSTSVPHVFLYEYVLDGSAPSVIPDDEGGGHAATRHLLSLGHRRVAYVNGDAGFEAARQRHSGYGRALREAGLDVDERLVIEAGTWREEGGFDAAHRLLDRPSPPTAIFFANDYLAIGALDAFRERSVRVPEDVSVLGFDDRSAARHTRPPLSTVRLPFAEMGEIAGQLLLRRIQGTDVAPGVQRVPCPIVERDSTAPPLPRDGSDGPNPSRPREP